MRVLARIAIFAIVAFAAITFTQLGSSQAQQPPEPKNLKVLPKDMSRREVTEIMRSFSHALGVRCSECHVPTKSTTDQPGELDYALDEKPEKEAARKMMRMVASVNEQIGKMGFKDAAQVRCVTCHHGVKRPETLAAVMMKSIEKDGMDGAIAKYRKLRDEYYGSAAYDFSSESLVEVASSYAEAKKDFDGAIRLLQLNLEFTPKDSDTYLGLGRMQMSKGDKAAAIASFEKALELDPNNRWAKQQLERAKSGQ